MYRICVHTELDLARVRDGFLCAEKHSLGDRSVALCGFVAESGGFTWDSIVDWIYENTPSLAKRISLMCASPTVCSDIVWVGIAYGMYTGLELIASSGLSFCAIQGEDWKRCKDSCENNPPRGMVVVDVARCGTLSVDFADHLLLPLERNIRSGPWEGRIVAAVSVMEDTFCLTICSKTTNDEEKGGTFVCYDGERSPHSTPSTYSISVAALQTVFDQDTHAPDQGTHVFDPDARVSEHPFRLLSGAGFATVMTTKEK